MKDSGKPQLEGSEGLNTERKLGSDGTAAKISWRRANRLKELADHHRARDCRSYLAVLAAAEKRGELPEGLPGIKILDNGGDRRNGAVRRLVAGFNTWYKQLPVHMRRGENMGTKLKASPVDEHQERSGVDGSPAAEFAASQGLTQVVDSPIQSGNTLHSTGIPSTDKAADGQPREFVQLGEADVLFELRQIQRKWDLSTEDLRYCVEVLGQIVD